MRFNVVLVVEIRHPTFLDPVIVGTFARDIHQQPPGEILHRERGASDLKVTKSYLVKISRDKAYTLLLHFPSERRDGKSARENGGRYSENIDKLISKGSRTCSSPCLARTSS